jgi:DNA primase
VVASMGTAVTEEQLTALKRYTANVYLCFDADAAGLGAMSRALGLARRLDLVLHVVRIPEGLDPADYVRAGHGGEEFRRLAARAQTLLQFHVRTVLSAHDLAKPEERTRALALLRGVLAQAASPLERDEEVRFVADSLRLSPESVRHLLSGFAAGGAPGAGSGAGPTAPTRLLSAERELEARFLAACLALPERGRELVAAVDDSFFTGLEARCALEGVRLRLEPQRAGKKSREVMPAPAAPGEEGDMLPEVVVRASTEQFSERVVQELYLRLQEAHVSRLIRVARSRLKVSAEADEARQEETRLQELEGIRRRLREAIRLIPVEE